MLYADLLSLHLVTFLMLFILVDEYLILDMNIAGPACFLRFPLHTSHLCLLAGLLVLAKAL